MIDLKECWLGKSHQMSLTVSLLLKNAFLPLLPFSLCPVHVFQENNTKNLSVPYLISFSRKINFKKFTFFWNYSYSTQFQLFKLFNDRYIRFLPNSRVSRELQRWPCFIQDDISMWSRDGIEFRWNI